MQNIMRNVSLLLSPSFAFEECLISVHYNDIDVVRSVRMTRILMFYTQQFLTHSVPCCILLLC